jgi:hypothetical protein
MSRTVPTPSKIRLLPNHSVDRIAAAPHVPKKIVQALLDRAK